MEEKNVNCEEGTQIRHRQEGDNMEAGIREMKRELISDQRGGRRG